MEMEYREGEIIRPSCSLICTCQNGGFDCVNVTCDEPNGAMCTAHGDPHYLTFDGHEYDFMGTCEYVLSRPCDRDDFIITGINKPVRKNPFASETDSVRIQIPNQGLEILLTKSKTKNGQIFIDNVLRSNVGDGVVYDTNGVQVFRKGGKPYVQLSLEGSFAVGVHWDGRRKVKITVSRQWQGTLCGLCGNYNGDKSDEYITPTNMLVNSVNEFGESWEYGKTTQDCKVPPPPPPCPADLHIEARERCSREFTGHNSIFRSCNKFMNPKHIVQACIYDYCNSSEEDREEYFCGSIHRYAEQCSSKGIPIPSALVDAICRKFSIVLN